MPRIIAGAIVLVKMKIYLKFHSKFKKAFPNGGGEIVLPEGANVQMLLDHICQTDEQRTAVFAADGKRLKKDVIVTKNRMFVFHMKRMETTLCDGDEVSIHYPACMG